MYELLILSFKIGIILSIFRGSGKIHLKIDIFLKYVNGSMYVSMHCFRRDAGSSSYPDAVFVIVDMLVENSPV